MCPLALLLLLAALPAGAVDCAKGAFTEARLTDACGPSSKDGDCAVYRHKFAAACVEIKDQAEMKLAGLKGRSAPTPEDLKEIQTQQKVVDVAKAAFADAVAASAAAQKLPPGDSALQRFGALESIPASQNFEFLGQYLMESVFEPPEPATEKEMQDGPKEKENEPGKTNAVETASNIERSAMNAPKPDVQQLALAGKVFAGSGQYAQADRVAQAIIKAAPEDPKGPNLAARAAILDGRPAEAAAWARKALALDPRDGEARRMLGFSESILSKSRLKRPSGKPPAFEQAEDAGSGPRAGAGSGYAAGTAGPGASGTGVPAGTAPALTPRHLTLAQGKAAVGDFAGAYGDLSRTLSLFPDDDAARAMRAEIALAMGNPEAALADAEHLLAKSPNDPRAMRAKASALLQLGRLDEALATVDRAILLEVLSASGHLIRAQILEKLGRAADAASEYREASRLDPALTPVTQEALRRMGLAPAAASSSPGRRRLVRFGLFGLALALLLAGFVSREKLRTGRLKTITSVPK